MHVSDVALFLVAGLVVVVKLPLLDSNWQEKLAEDTNGPPVIVRGTIADPSVLRGVSVADGHVEEATSVQVPLWLDGMHCTEDKHQLQKGRVANVQSPHVLGLEQL